MHRSIFIATVLAVLGFGSAAMATVPDLIPVVGVVTNQSGVAVDGDFNVVFTIYTQETSGATVWSETYDATSTPARIHFEDGLFQAYLGSVTPLDFTDFYDNAELWLGMKVGADVEMTRVRIDTSPYSIEAGRCAQVGDLEPGDIQPVLASDACTGNTFMQGWNGSAATCNEPGVPDSYTTAQHTWVAANTQAPIDQEDMPCNYGIEGIDTNGDVMCAEPDVVTMCTTTYKYMGSDGLCHPAPYACTADQVMAGDGTCQEGSHKCSANQYIDGDGTCRTGAHSCNANQVLVAGGSGAASCTTAGFGLMPIGSITAWAKNLTGVPTLPSGWVECNGQTLADAGSPLNGQVIPNLNSAVSAGLKGYFLRGNTTSGSTETDLVENHTHGFVEQGFSYDSNCWSHNSCSGGYTIYTTDTSRTTADNNGGGGETRPYSYSVVWIMRVK
ncbi:MAG: hypothetical protein PHU25_20880 [Deltaproteobacteria bacterium]|nr:hypothetical protein [Deltaproteobacteria bacterium]